MFQETKDFFNQSKEDLRRKGRKLGNLALLYALGMGLWIFSLWILHLVAEAKSPGVIHYVPFSMELPPFALTAWFVIAKNNIEKKG